LQADTFISPQTTAGETQFNFLGGDMTTVFHDFETLYNAKTVCATTGRLCSAEPCVGTCSWLTLVVVYDFPSCSNPKGALTIMGFATARIYDVQGAPDRTISARVECNAVEDNTRGGGANFGTKGSIPGLVQ
jgi:hypothetical protein